MAAIVLRGQKQVYVLSVLTPEANNFPEWGGVYIAVNASHLGMRMNHVVAIGACSSFNKYQQKINDYLKSKCTHIYLLPEQDKNMRQFAIQDLAQTEAFSHIFNHLTDENQLPFAAWHTAS